MILSKSQHEILNLIYHYPGIRLTELIKKARISANTAKKNISILLNRAIIKEEKIIGGKRIILKRFYPSFSTEEGKNIFSLIELEKTNEFFKKNKSLKGPFKQLLENIGDTFQIILIFGSFASNSQTSDSDLDILFLAEKEIDRNILKKEIERSFITFNQEISPRIDTLDSFKNNLNKDIYQTIIKNHVIIKGAINFIEIL